MEKYKGEAQSKVAEMLIEVHHKEEEQIKRMERKAAKAKEYLNALVSDQQKRTGEMQVEKEDL